MKKIFLGLAVLAAFSARAQKITSIEGNGTKLMVANMTVTGRIAWGGYEQIGAPAKSETDGAANTKAIVAAVGKNSGFDGKPYAAKVCDTLNLGGYDDWYLPCQEETNVIHANYEKIGLGEKMTIWSSTEANGTQAVAKYLYSGAFYNEQKVNQNDFVCVRKVK